MKNKILYIVIGVAAMISIFLLMKGDRGGKSKRKLNERVTFRKGDAIPYGGKVVYNMLPVLFPQAAVYSNYDELLYSDLSAEDSVEGKQLYIIISPSLNISEDDITILSDFIRRGNDVFISAAFFSPAFEKAFRLSINQRRDNIYTLYLPKDDTEDTVSVAVFPPLKEMTYAYPGKMNLSYFEKYDIAYQVLGENTQQKINMVQAKIGAGNLFIQTTPFAFTNYFLLHKNNMAYAEAVFSLLAMNNPSVVIWDEYFLENQEYTPKNNRGGKNWLSVFMKERGLRWALLTAIAATILFVLLAARRRKRIIPEISMAKNDSLAFVSTIGRLYANRGDHKNLAEKMSSYFLEHIRSKYKLSTTVLNEEWAENLSFKTGVEMQLIMQIVNYIHYIDTTTHQLSEEYLHAYYLALNKFYQQA